MIDDETSVFPMTASARQLLGGVLKEGDRYERARVANEVALAVLGHFGDPSNFWGLVATDAFAPLRVAITGRRVSPPLFESMEILGKTSTLARIAAASGRLGAPEAR